jgi:hypothetical protein
MLKSRFASDVPWDFGITAQLKFFCQDSTITKKTKKYIVIYFLVLIFYENLRLKLLYGTALPNSTATFSFNLGMCLNLR